MAESDPNEMVRMTHASSEAVSGQVTRQAFEYVWSPKGWKLATAEQTAAADAAEGNPDEYVALKSTKSTTPASATK